MAPFLVSVHDRALGRRRWSGAPRPWSGPRSCQRRRSKRLRRRRAPPQLPLWGPSQRPRRTPAAAPALRVRWRAPSVRSSAARSLLLAPLAACRHWAERELDSGWALVSKNVAYKKKCSCGVAASKMCIAARTQQPMRQGGRLCRGKWQGGACERCSAWGAARLGGAAAPGEIPKVRSAAAGLSTHYCARRPAPSAGRGCQPPVVTGAWGEGGRTISCAPFSGLLDYAPGCSISLTFHCVLSLLAGEGGAHVPGFPMRACSAPLEPGARVCSGVCHVCTHRMSHIRSWAFHSGVPQGLLCLGRSRCRFCTTSLSRADCISTSHVSGLARASTRSTTPFLPCRAALLDRRKAMYSLSLPACMELSLWSRRLPLVVPGAASASCARPFWHRSGAWPAHGRGRRPCTAGFRILRELSWPHCLLLPALRLRITCPLTKGAHPHTACLSCPTPGPACVGPCTCFG